MSENQSAFDPALLLDATVNDAFSTASVPVPVGEYNAVLEKITPRSWTSKDGTKSGLALDIFYAIDDAGVKALLERDKVTVKQGIMLDLTEQGNIDTGKGKNVALGRLREAVGLNIPGQPFSFRMLEGQPLKVAVKHRVDGDAIYAEVAGTLKLA